MKRRHVQAFSRAIHASKFKSLLCIGLLFACMQGCTEGENTPNSPSGSIDMKDSYPFAYDLKAPDATAFLPSKLEEISGLAWLSENLLATVQDEKGKVYLVDAEEGEIVDKIKFAKKGDYEGIAAKGRDIWVVRSDGQLFEISEDRGVVEYATGLDRDSNVEGLSWYAAKGIFLLACKGYPGEGEDLEGKKTCYAFDPVEGKLDSKPYLTIDLDEVYTHQLKTTGTRKEDIRTDFRPSGIEVHPLTGDIYLISSVGKKLLVLSPEGQLLHVASLRYAHFPQPEGICFSPQGVLYLSSEGDGGKGSIMRFNP